MIFTVFQIFKFIMDLVIKNVRHVQDQLKANVFLVRDFICNWLMAHVKLVLLDIMIMVISADFVQRIVKLVHLIVKPNSLYVLHAFHGHL